MWFELMQHIKQYIDNKGKDWNVILGAMRPQAAKISSHGVVMIIRGETTPGDNTIQSEMQQEIFVEVWGREDSPDLAQGYELMANLESNLDVIMSDLRKQCSELNPDICIIPDTGYQIIDIKCTSKVGDHDSVRPLIGTQYRFVARLINLNEETNGGIY
jgi:hypothetical protein